MSWVPTFVVETSYKRWELRCELHYLFKRQAVAQRMQNRPQSRVRTSLIRPSQFILYGMHPFVRLLYVSVQTFDFAHTPPQFSFFSY